jgi:hypothetical protein
MSALNSSPIVSPDALAAFQKGCAGKDRYPSQNAADAALRLMKQGAFGRKHGDGRWDDLRSYECRFCGEFHHGH